MVLPVENEWFDNLRSQVPAGNLGTGIHVQRRSVAMKMVAIHYRLKIKTFANRLPFFWESYSVDKVVKMDFDSLDAFFNLF